MKMIIIALSASLLFTQLAFCQVQEKIKDVRFGVNHLVEGFFEDIATSGAGWISMSPVVIWDAIEPQQGSYHWKNLDNNIKEIQQLGLEPTITFMPVNRWATPHTYQDYLKGALKVCDFPANVDAQQALSQLLTAMADRYDDDGVNDADSLIAPVKNWHLLEEWPTFWYEDPQATPENPLNAKRYVEFLRLASNAIKKEIPDARVIATGFATDKLRMLAFVDGFIEDSLAGAFNSQLFTRDEIKISPAYRQLSADVSYILNRGSAFFDVIDIHCQDAKLIFTEGKITWLKNRMSSFGYTKPIWVIESGGPFKRLAGDTTSVHGDLIFGAFTLKENAEFVVKMHALAYALGVERFQWGWKSSDDSIWDGPFRLMALRDVQGNPKPAYYTYKIMQNFMNHFDRIEKLVVSNEISLFKISCNQKFSYLAWLNADKSLTVDLSPVLGSSVVRLTHIVTETDANYLPIVMDEEFRTSDQVTLSETPVFIQMGSTKVSSERVSAPKMIELGQNYPNPFNPITTIRFSLPYREHVTLKVFDVLGREVAMLVDGELNAGEHLLVYEAKSLSNGLYICRLQVGQYVQQIKMELVK